MNINQNTKILISGIFSLIIGVGVARFAFTSLLPNMLDDFLSIKQAGFLASINYAGYLFGSIVAVFIQNMNTKVLLFRLGLFISLATTLILALSTNYLFWQFSRIIAGFGSAMVLVVGSSIVMSLLESEDKTKSMGIHFSGIGFSILCTDILVKILNEFNFNWHNIWLAIIIFGFILSVIPFLILTNKNTKKQKFIKIKFDTSIFTPFVILLIFAYFTEGVGFVIQATFLPDIVNQIIPGYGALTWLFVGLSGITSCIILMNLAHKFGSINIIILALFLQIIGILIPTFTKTLTLNILSAMLYGGTFIGLVALFMHLGGKMSKGNPVVLMGALTTSYGIGQVIAPLYSVKMVEMFGSYDYALYLTAFIVFGGLILMLISKKFYI